MGNLLLWLLVVELIGFITLPLAFFLFKRLPDRGITIAKILGLLISSYIFWVVGLTGFVANSRPTFIGILVAITFCSAWLLRGKMSAIGIFLWRERAHLIVGEVVFLVMFFTWAMIVAHVPAISHTEKPMDFAFLNAILSSSRFPPEDVWLSGHSISYYYFGHFMMAALTKLTGITSNFTYNLSVVLIPALVSIGSYGLTYNLVRLSGASNVKSILLGLAGPVFVGLIGNLVGVLDFVQAQGWGSEAFWSWVSIKGLVASTAGGVGVFPEDHLWWWHSTRVIDTIRGGESLDFTITEFPFFSFLLGDLHAHVMALPFLILSLTMSLNVLVSIGGLGFGWLKRNLWESLVVALSLGALAFINVWDLPVFAALFLGILFITALKERETSLKKAGVSALVVGVPILATAVVMFLPYYLSIQTQVSGVSALHGVNTRPVFFILIWGFFLLIVIPVLIRQLWSLPYYHSLNRSILYLTAFVTLLPVLVWCVIVFCSILVDDGVGRAFITVGARFGELVPLILVIWISMYSALVRAREGPLPLVFSLTLVALAFYLMMGVELFYLEDFLPLRMNTVFKLYYQAWLLLAVGAAFAIHYWLSMPSPKKLLLRLCGHAWIITIIVFLAATLYYPTGAALDRVDSSSGPVTLDGLAFVRAITPGEYEAISTLRDDVTTGSILEAVGDQYSQFGRVAASTGVSSPLNWPGHEIQWRGSSQPLGNREQDVRTIYQSNDWSEVDRLLDQYQIQYVYLSPREIAKYGTLGLAKFSRFMKIYFQSGDVVIYERMDSVSRTVNNGD